MISVYFGQDYGLALQKAKEGVRESLKRQGIETYLTYDGYNNTVSEVVNECSSVSLFEEKKTVLFTQAYFLSSGEKQTKGTIKEAMQDYKGLKDYILSPNQDCDLLFVVNENLNSKSELVLALKELPARFVNCAEMSEEDYIAYAFQYAKERKSKIDREAAKLLYKRTSYLASFKTHGNYMQFTNELEKLLTYTDNVKEVDVKTLVHEPLEDNAFDVVSSLLNKKIDKSIKIYKDLRKAGNEPYKLIPILASQFRLFALVSYHLERRESDQDIASALKITTGRLYFLKKECASYSFLTFIKVLADLGEIEKGIRLYGDNGDDTLLLFLTLFNKTYARR